MKKRVLSIVLALCLVFSLLPVSALADTTASGTCGDNLTWTLKNGTLTISGTGDMDDYDEYYPPWNDYGYDIVAVVIEPGVTSIGIEAFYDCSSLTSVTIPNGVTRIGSHAFDGCSSLTDVTIPDSVTSMGNTVFSGCSSLTSVTLSNGLTRIGSYVFSGCSSLTDVTIPNGVTSICEYAFDDCSSLESIVIPYSVTSIKNGAFSGCIWLENVNYTGTIQQWKKVTVGDDNAYLKEVSIHCLDGDIVTGNYCGENLSWTYKNGTVTISGTGDMYDYDEYLTPWYKYTDDIVAIVIGSGVTSIGDNAFAGCDSLQSVTIPNSVRSIGDRAFLCCINLKSITIPNGVTKFGDWTFSRCYNLKTVNIPSSVTDIGYGPFSSCESLESITVSASSKSFCSVNGVLFSKDKTKMIQYPMAKEGAAYSLPGGVKSVEVGAFENCDSLKKITIPNSVTSIQYGSFRGCINLTNISMPTSVKKINYFAFKDCRSLKDVYYSGSSAQWKSINLIENGNDELLNAKIHYNYVAAPVIKITTSAGKPKISWKKVDGATKYYVYRSTDGKKYSLLVTTEKTSVTNSKAKIGTTYYYKVKAAKVVNGKTVKSAYSNIKSIKCTPAAPVVSISRSNGKPKLTWKAVTGASKYYIYRSTDGKTYKQYTTTTKTSYTNTGAASGKKYYYKVKAVAVVNKKNVFSAYSSAKNLMTTIATPTVSITTANGKPKITWKAVTGADKYIVYRSTDGKSFKQLSTTTKTSLTNTGAKKNTKYYYKVKAVCTKNTSANSALSKAVSIKATK